MLRCVALCVAMAVSVLAASDAARFGKRTLVVTESSATHATHSSFLSGLTGRGHELTYASASQADLELIKYGEFLFDNIVLLTPATEDFAGMEVQDLLAFVAGGGNVLVAASENLPETSAVRDFAAECGVDFDAEGSVVIDHMAYDSSASSDHSTVISSGYASSQFVVGDSASRGSVLFRGIGQAVDPENIFAIKVLVGTPTSYSADPTKAVDSYPESAGEQVQLVTSIQARNNARVTFFGSSWMMSNDAFDATINGDAPANNQYFVDQVSRWTFQEQGVIRATAIRHHRADGSAPEKQLAAKQRPNLPVSIYPDPEIAPQSDVYRIKDDLEYQMDVEQLQDGAWRPFKADDMQMEFVMLDAYVRTTMTHDDSGTFTAAFKAPDTYGIFKFRVMYRRAGLSVIHHETQVSVRPFRHNEYERFIEAAFPYYASTLSIMVGFFLFSVYFLYSK